MDGFEGDSGVIVIAATNRPDALDPALLRPGRFDRRIAVQPPDKVGREAILRIHSRGMPLDDEVDLGRIAASTPGMTGADLALLVNEAALFAARREHADDRAARLHRLDREDRARHRAPGRHVAGRPRAHRLPRGRATRSSACSPPGADPVRKVSIIPRGQALGVTLSTPEADKYGYERAELLGRIRVMLGGRAAEKVVYGETTTGAESDIQQLTRIARSMVGRWGMSDAIGAVAVSPSDERGPAAARASRRPPSTRSG